MVVIALPSYLMIPLLRTYEFVRGSQVVYGLTRGLAATAVGLLLATTWNLSKDSLGTPVTWIVLGVALALFLFSRLPTLVSLVLATGRALRWCSARCTSPDAGHVLVSN